MSHMWKSHVTHVKESCHTCERVMSHMWKSHFTHVKESYTGDCRTRCVLSSEQVTLRVLKFWCMCHSCEWVKHQNFFFVVVSLMWMSNTSKRVTVVFFFEWHIKMTHQGRVTHVDESFTGDFHTCRVLHVRASCRSFFAKEPLIIGLFCTCFFDIYLLDSWMSRVAYISKNRERVMSRIHMSHVANVNESSTGCVR